ncbi:MAG: CU044_2847 family protein [Streptosporangiaceae bacterium]
MELPDGGVIYAEVTPIGGADVSVRDRLRLDQADDLLRQVGGWSLDAVRTALPERPDEFEVEFGMKLGVKAGSAFWILTEATGEASFRVCMRWKHDGTLPGAAESDCSQGGTSPAASGP